MSITYWREQIDEIDRTLVSLISERARCARKIGSLKREQQLPIVDAAREAEVQKGIEALNSGPLSTDALWRIFERIIDEMRLLQEDVLKDNQEQTKARQS
jgi:chorismate mutase